MYACMHACPRSSLAHALTLGHSMYVAVVTPLCSFVLAFMSKL